jgi:hypothetical protein
MPAPSKSNPIIRYPASLRCRTDVPNIGNAQVRHRDAGDPMLTGPEIRTLRIDVNGGIHMRTIGPATGLVAAAAMVLSAAGPAASVWGATSASRLAGGGAGGEGGQRERRGEQATSERHAGDGSDQACELAER